MCCKRWVWKCNTIHIFVNKIHILSALFFLYPTDVCFMCVRYFFASFSALMRKRPEEIQQQQKMENITDFCSFFSLCYTSKLQHTNRGASHHHPARRNRNEFNLLNKTKCSKKRERIERTTLKAVNGDCCGCTAGNINEWIVCSLKCHTRHQVSSIESSEYNYAIAFFLSFFSPFGIKIFQKICYIT